MVLYSDNPSQMYKQLHALHRAAEGRGRKRKLQCHNFVNNADAVPRFLGSSLDAVHQAMENYAPSMSVRSWLLGGHTYVTAVGTLQKYLFASFAVCIFPERFASMGTLGLICQVVLCGHQHTCMAIVVAIASEQQPASPGNRPSPLLITPHSAACFSNLSSCRQLPLHHMAMSYQA